MTVWNLCKSRDERNGALPYDPAENDKKTLPEGD